MRFWPFGVLRFPDKTISRVERLERAQESVDQLLEENTELSGRLAQIERERLSVAILEDRLELLEALEPRLDLVEAQRKEISLAVAEGIERVDRAERRIKATVQRARKELKDRGYADPGLDAEAQEFRDVDGKGSDNGGVQPVQESLGADFESPSSVKGVTLGQLQRVRGI